MPDASLLETFQTPASATIVIEHINEEFTSVCPVTGHPDFGVVTVRYIPAPKGTPHAASGCVELKSLKMYFQSFRNEGIFYEAVTDQVRTDLANLLHPVWLEVETNWRGRGGIRSVIRASAGNRPDRV